MPHSKHLSLILSLFLLLAGTLWSQDRNLSQLKKNHFLKAIEGWDKVLTKPGGLDENKYRALIGQAMAYERLGDLYKTFHQFNIDMSSKFYSKLEKHTSSSLLKLYRCQVEYYRENYKQALGLCENVLSQKKLHSLVRDMANVYRHYSKAGLRGSTMNMASKSKHPSVRWQIAVLNGDKKIPTGIKARGVRSLRSNLVLSLRSGASEKKVSRLIDEVLEKSKNAELYLNKGTYSQIDFYDPEIFKALSQGFYYLAMLKNQILQKNKSSFIQMANKIEINSNLAKVQIELGLYQEAAKLVSSSSTKKGLILAAKIKRNLNMKQEASKLLERALSKFKNSPDIQRDVGFAYYETGINYKKALQLTQNASNQKNKPSYHLKHAMVLAEKEESELEALEAFVRGYKIEHRNDVEHNAPIYMTEYAYAIFRFSKLRYPEVTETIYYLKKEYPDTKQLYYIVQGVGAAEAPAWSPPNVLRKPI